MTCQVCYTGFAIAVMATNPESNMSKQTTSIFTVLVTLIHDTDQGTSPSRVAEIVQCALEEGTSCSGSFSAAQVDAFKGKAVTDTMLESRSEVDRFHRVLPLHNKNAHV